MAAELLEIETLVLIDGEDIDFIGAWGELGISQLATVALLSTASDLAITQLASVALVLADPDMAISQFATVALCSPGPIRLVLDRVIPLDCWQPCTAYGTHAIIVYLNGAN